LSRGGDTKSIKELGANRFSGEDCKRRWIFSQQITESMEIMKKLLLTLTLLAALSASAQTVPTRIYGDGQLTNSLVVFTNFVKVLKIQGYNSTNAVSFVQVFQSPVVGTNAVPTNGTIPTISYKVAATSAFEISFAPYGLDLQGCYITISQQAHTNTLGAATAGSIQAIIKR